MDEDTSRSSCSNNDVIEISDDSCEAIYDKCGASGSGLNKLKRPATDSDNYSDESDDVQFIEEESESEPEYDCDCWDDDCIVLTQEVTTKTIEGIHHMKFISLPEFNKTKKLKISVELNQHLLDESNFKSYIKNFLNDNAFEDKHCELMSEPWKVLVLNNLISDPEVLDNVREEFNELKWYYRTMDLYEFNQSDDLKNLHEENINLVFDFIKGDLKDWVSKLTGIELVQVSATCSFYCDTDFLLVHDDQRDTRAVAFVLYLTGKEGWSADWGGCLQLLNTDEYKQPLRVARHILPRNNQLVLFPVSDRSYHQVEEVQCKNFCRLSINGWFHTKEPLTFETPLYTPPSDGLYSTNFIQPLEADLSLTEFIDNDYLDGPTATSIQSYIEEHSEMSLELYFNEEKFNSVVDVIKTSDINWKQMGPPNRRNYQYISSEAELPPTLNEFITLMKSKIFFHCLDQYTGLELKKMRWELQKWTPGSYSLITQENPDRLDVMFCMGDTAVVGGKTHYVTLEDQFQTALITTGCEVNSLNLVYGDTARYTFLVSKYSKSKEYYMFFASYYEDGDKTIGNDDDDVAIVSNSFEIEEDGVDEVVLAETTNETASAVVNEGHTTENNVDLGESSSTSPKQSLETVD